MSDDDEREPTRKTFLIAYFAVFFVILLLKGLQAIGVL